MNLPNKLTVIRIVLAPLFLVLLLVEFPFHHLIAGLVFGAAALTDLFDGRIARSRGLITNLGKFLDPLADKMLTTAAFLGFLIACPWPYEWCRQVAFWSVMVILWREFMVMSVRLTAASDGKVVAASMAGKIKTVMQFVAILYLLAALEFRSWTLSWLSAVPAVVNTVLLAVGAVLIAVCAVATAVSGFQYVYCCRSYFQNGR